MFQQSYSLKYLNEFPGVFNVPYRKVWGRKNQNKWNILHPKTLRVSSYQLLSFLEKVLTNNYLQTSCVSCIC